MVAGTVLIELFAELALYVAAGFWLWRAHGVAPVMSALLAITVFFAVRAAIVGLQYAIAWRARPHGRPPLSAPELVAAVLRELKAVLLVYTWGQALQGLLVPLDWRGAASPAALPVLFVHGIYCNAGVWYRLLRHLERRGVSRLFTINLEPPWAGIDDFARQLAARVEEVRRFTSAAQVILVTHSMGGLVSRAYLARLGGTSRTARLITIGTPHRGSVLARLALGQCGADMVPGGPWLAALEKAEAGAPRVPTVSIFSWHDNMVSPQSNASLRGARNVPLERLGHLELLLDPGVFRLVADEIAAARTR
jgi:predicted alpha/beta hydrolase family esterase